MDHTDEEVVGRILGGETALFELLMRRYNERLYRAARAITRDDREAEDVLQQSYVNAFRHLRQFDGRSRFSTWLTRIVINESLARVRHRHRHAPLDQDPPEMELPMARHPLNDPERLAYTGELRTLLEVAIDRLPDGAREVFVLRDVEGLSTAETAESLEVSTDVVKQRLSRARAMLRRTLFEQTGATAPEAFRFERPRCDRIVSLVLAQIGDAPPAA